MTHNIKHPLFALALLGVSTIAAKGQCDAQNTGFAPVNVLTSGSTIVIPAKAGRSIHLCLLSVAFASAVNVTLQSTTSGGAQTALSGAYQLTSGNLLLNANYHGAVLTGLGNGCSLAFLAQSWAVGL